MTTTRHRVAVVGGGAMGASAAWHLVRRGHDVTVFEQFARDHDRGSSHGNARIFRLAYDDPTWVELVVRALDGWREVQEHAGQMLIDHVGGVDHGEVGEVAAIAAGLAAAGQRHERLTPEAAADRWPGLVFEGEVVFQPDAGTTDAAATVAALLDLAEHHGAEVRTHATVDRLEVDRVHVHVHADGDTTAVDRVVVTAGAWAPTVLHGLVDLPPMQVTREHPVLFARVADARPATWDWPTSIHLRAGLAKTGGVDDHILGYGVPTPDGTVKVGQHHAGPLVDPDDPGDPDSARVDRVRAYVARWMPGLDPDSTRVEPCLYTTTPTTDFVVDRLGPVAVAAGFSGHGFKFVPLVGQWLADLVEDQPGPLRFRLPA